MDMMLLVQGACCSNQWLAAVLLSLCCLLPSCLPAGQSVDFPGTAVDNLVVRKGETAVLRCYLEDGASKGAWLNRSSIVFAGEDKWSVDPRVSIATANKREYSLQIQDVDVSDDGPYTCSVQTQHTPRTMQIYLTVKVSPKIFHISNDIVVNEGSNFTLACLATGKPDPSISWRHISPTAKPFESGQYLDIYGITRDQAGEYECSAENDVSVPDVKKVKVTVNFAPTIQEIKSSGVTLGGTGYIRCESAGVPPPAFEWYKGERKLFSGQQGIAIKSFSSRSLLNMNNVTEEHFGNYTCVATNKLGTTNASLLLNQIIEPTTTSPVTSPDITSPHHPANGANPVLRYSSNSHCMGTTTGCSKEQSQKARLSK
ncbi:neuronal growth regulator 1 isoform X3 [Hemicordylus capensis]|uniref:neuronal growth regulator 1 isoform X3 n=1 Tax=Hemicordylus capensis TaxID=884348 RepID=UPI0023038CC4|nr:neuronal growth regulator 1 isoform X3 [Hemicordylus capensis]